MSTDIITLLVFIGFWPVWLGWEIYLLIRRGQGVNVKTISMVARDRGWQLNGVVYVYCGLASHFWWNWKAASQAGTVAFWVLAVFVFISDLFTLLLETAFGPSPSGYPKPWWRNPLIWAVVAILAGHFLFPQPG